MLREVKFRPIISSGGKRLESRPNDQSDADGHRAVAPLPSHLITTKRPMMSHMHDHNIHYILGAPGSGKTTIVPYLRELLPRWIIIDWDELMVPAEMLAGRSIRDNESLWKPYAALVKSVLDMLAPNSVLLLGVCTPAQLAGWPIREWVILDCDDRERTARLQQRGESADEIQEAVSDAAEYRALGLRTTDGTTITPQETAQAIAGIICMP
ncbi:predicted protein [Aspergillus nidulans FGSC A4]|uniref:Uncharacterized protein n=1 Tax=Emericella nidulans (strain FGSC A4 / ATCC 38163 / CBS 112.46 / NRRL 194 / M139) TaxID=227321 RepID=Q5ATK8_EMENI|nr:hypothetical protein [Aspergillus nidulans FGSC A4]EAA66892.1 predicted protein [Aspergillus nidulans FGSC A4]CBF80407.1 TPA: conserved hypothetical protein [Aspergillus nidulans FGSC A4]|eukprot:XP_681641.1 predicted protein [Aspergillus nidulans FGSC A4]